MKNFFTQFSIQSFLKNRGILIFLMGFTSLINAQYTLTEADVAMDENGYITSCSYDFTEKAIVIPETIGGQAVIGIKDHYSSYGAIFASKGLTSITFPEGFKHVGDYSFYNNALTSLVLPEGVEYVGKSAFQSNDIVDLTLPSTLRIIESGAFQSNDIVSVALPEGLEKIMSDVFYFNQITSITLPSTLELIASYGLGTRIEKVILPVPSGDRYSQWASSKGSVFNTGDEIDYDETCEYWAVINYTLTDDDVTVENGVITACTVDMDGIYLTIPEQLDGQTITGIAGSTYIDNEHVGPFVNKGIRNIQLPSAITQIEAYTFFNNKIGSVFIPSGVKGIGQAAFAKNNIADVEFGDNCQLLFITWNAFNDNYGLSFSLPEVAIDGFSGWQSSDGILYQAGDNIGSLLVNYAAKVPYTLTSDDVVVENGIIQSTSYNSNYKFITIPDELDGQTIKGIKALSENGIFSHKGIYELTLPTTLEELCFAAFGWNNLKSIDLSRCENLHTIGQYAFYSNSITNLVIPASVTSLGYNSFAYNKLESVEFEANSQLNLIEANAFNANTQDLEVAFPSPVKDGYTFKFWVNWDDVTFEGGVNIPDFKREYEAVFIQTPTHLTETASPQIEIVACNNHVTINSPEPLKVEIFSLGGQLVHQASVSSGQQSIDLAPFARGSYILKAQSRNGAVITEKIIKL